MDRIAVVISALLLAGVCRATSVVPMNFADTVESADSAVAGIVVSVTPVETQVGLADEVTVAVSDAVFSSGKTTQTITWRQLKRLGRVPVSGMPAFTTGSETLVFLAGPGRGTGLRSPVGFGQGAFKLVRDPKTGIAYARNEFMNSNLTRDLDTTAVATQLAQRRLAGRPPSPAAVAAEAKAIQGGFMRRHAGGTSLELLVETARMFHQMKQNGQSAAAEFRVQPQR